APGAACAIRSMSATRAGGMLCRRRLSSGVTCACIDQSPSTWPICPQRLLRTRSSRGLDPAPLTGGELYRRSGPRCPVMGRYNVCNHTFKVPHMTDSHPNPMGTDGFEFVEYTAPDPQLLRTLFERLGFPVVARHRSKNVTLHRQGDVN